MVKFRKSWNSLAGKLIVAVGIVMSMGSVAFGLLIYKYQESVTYRNLTSHAEFSSTLVMKGLHNGMLTAHREVIQSTIEEQGALPDVREIIIYDTSGRAVYASKRMLIGTSIDLEEEAFARALKGTTVPPTIETRTKAPALENQPVKEERILYSYAPIRNDVSCYTAACHVHLKSDDVLGVLYTSFTASSIVDASRRILYGTLLFAAVFVATISVFLCIILYNLVSKPVALIEEGMKRVARGDFEHPIKIDSADEMGILATTFNAMSGDIYRYEQKLKNWAEELQREVDKKTKEIVDAQEQLVNAEKLASLGRMSAGVAHELNSPLTGIVTYSHLMQERLPMDDKENREDLDVIIEQAQRCSKIIKGLLRFSRKGGSEKISASINELLESCVSMVQNQQNFYDIEIKTDYTQNLPSIFVDANQIQQVILNLLTNAADAMNEQGTIMIATRTTMVGDNSYVEMVIADTGPGIIPEHLSRIFEPFFTTKPVGKGTGLGLPVSYGIIKRHGGDIVVRSKAGEGTAFIVRIPVGSADTVSTADTGEEADT